MLEARDRVGGRIWTEHLADGSAYDRGGAWLGPDHEAIFRLAGEVGVGTYKTYVQGAHLLVGGGQTRRYTGLIPKISPVAVGTIALAQMRLDRMAKKVPLDAPWTAAKAQEWDQRSIAWYLEHTGIRTDLARDLFDMAVRGLFAGDLNEVSFLNLLMLVRGHGSINTLFSIEKGSQENLVDGGAGSIAALVAEELGDAVRLSAPVRAVSQRADHVLVEAGDLTIGARHAVVAIPPVLALEIAWDPVLPDDRTTLYRNSIAGPEAKTIVVYDEPFWRSDGFSGQSSEPGSAAEVTIDASPASGNPGVLASFTFGSVAERVHALDPDAAAYGGARRARRPVRAAGRVAIRIRRDRVVDRGLDARVLDGAFRSGHPHAVRTSAPRAMGPSPLGRHRDGDDLIWRHRRRRAIGGASRDRGAGRGVVRRP